MAHEPKLEIYKLKLLNKEDGRVVTFREFLRYKLNKYGTNPVEPITESDIFKDYYTDLLKKTNANGYNVDEKKKKGFTVAFEEKDGKRKSLISSPLAKDWIIDGILEGGKHGLKRYLGEVEDKTKKTNIGTKHIVGDRFYFLLYTPLEHSEAILMIQGYTEIKISDIFRNYLTDYFIYHKQIVSEIELFIPNSFKEKYLKEGVFKSIRFSSPWAMKADFSGEIKHKEFDLQVKIEIIDKSKKKTSYKELKELFNIFGESRLKLFNGDEKSLKGFKDKGAKMHSKNKDFPMDIDDEDNIKPVILLKNEGIEIGEGEVPNFEQIERYCRGILEDVINEVMPSHGIPEL